jgi:hypothetical protein
MEEWEEKNILILPCHPIGSFGNPGITDEMVKRCSNLAQVSGLKFGSPDQTLQDLTRYYDVPLLSEEFDRVGITS